jgi:hypothetical protein
MVDHFSGNFNGQFNTITLSLRDGATFNRIEKGATVKNIGFIVSIDENNSSKIKSCLAMNNNGTLEKIAMVCLGSSTVYSEVGVGFVHTNDFDGVIKDIEIFQNRIFGKEAYGFSKYNYGVINNVSITDETVVGQSMVGGFTGFNYDIITDISIKGNIISTKVESGSEVGGFSFLNFGIVERVSVEAKVEIELVNTLGNLVYFGGFSTYNSGSVEDSNIKISVEISMDEMDDKIEMLGKFYGDDLLVSSSNRYDVTFNIIKY